MSFPRFAAAVLAVGLPAPAATLIFDDPASAAIPDGSSSGLGRVIAVSSPGTTIVSVQVDLHIAAAAGDVAFTGDLYAFLAKGDQIAVLLNRPGRTSSAPAGYSDNQAIDVSFTADAANDIHVYQDILGGAPDDTINGVWAADARETDPASVLDSDPRTATLSGFAGVESDGDWSLFVADVSTGATHELVSWTLTLETIPEPSVALLALAGLLPLARRRR